jgi:hypothetical protein
MLLRTRESLNGLASVATLDEQRPVAGCDERADPEVDADRPAGPRQRLGGHVDASHAQPPAASLPSDGDRLCGAAKRTMHPDLDVTQTVKMEATALGIETPPVAVLPLHGVPTAHRLEPRKPWRLTGPTPPVERTERSIETLQRAPTHRYTLVENVGSNLPKIGESAALIEVGDRSAFPRPRPTPILQRRVVQLTLAAQQIIERETLSDRRLQEIAIRTATASHLQKMTHCPPVQRRDSPRASGCD